MLCKRGRSRIDAAEVKSAETDRTQGMCTAKVIERRRLSGERQAEDITDLGGGRPRTAGSLIVEQQAGRVRPSQYL